MSVKPARFPSPAQSVSPAQAQQSPVCEIEIIYPYLPPQQYYVYPSLREYHGFDRSARGGFAFKGPGVSPKHHRIDAQYNLRSSWYKNVPRPAITALWIKVIEMDTNNGKLKNTWRLAMPFIPMASAYDQIEIKVDPNFIIQLKLTGLKIRKGFGMNKTKAGTWELDPNYSYNAYWQSARDMNQWVTTATTTSSGGNWTTVSPSTTFISAGTYGVSDELDYRVLEESMRQAILGPPIVDGLYWGKRVAGVQFVTDSSGNPFSMEKLMDKADLLNPHQPRLMDELREQEARLRGAAFMLKLLRERMEAELGE